MTTATLGLPTDRDGHVPTSGRYAATITDLDTRVTIVELNLGSLIGQGAGPATDVVAAVEALGWEVRLDETVQPGALVYQPAALRLTVHDAGELLSLLAYAEEAREARTWLRAHVHTTALRLGLRDARAFARPATR